MTSSQRHQSGRHYNNYTLSSCEVTISPSLATWRRVRAQWSTDHHHGHQHTDAHTQTHRETDRQQTYVRWWRTMPPNSNWRRFWCIVVMGNIEMFASVSHQYNHYFTWSQWRTVDYHELITPPWKCIFGKCCLWLWPSNPWPWKCDQFVALCGNHLCKFWLKSFQRLRRYRVNKISLWPSSLGDFDRWPSDLVNVISVMWTWYWITVISFIKILPFVLEVQRW